MARNDSRYPDAETPGPAATLSPEFPPGAATCRGSWRRSSRRSCGRSGFRQSAEKLLDTGLREVKPPTLKRHQLLQVPDALLGDCQLCPCVQIGLLRRFRHVRVCRHEDKDNVDVTLLYPLHRELPLGDPSVESG